MFLPRDAAGLWRGRITPPALVAPCLSELMKSRIARPCSLSGGVGCKQSGPGPNPAVWELPLIPSPSIFGKGMENIVIVQQIKMGTM